MWRPLAVPLAVLVHHVAASPVQKPYDCTVGLNDWHRWDQHKKDWCCQNEQKACEPRHYPESPNCQGYSEEYGECSGPPCHHCTPVDCLFDAWGDWYGGGSCSGVHYRHRSIKQTNNECGHPCKGAKGEAVRVPPEPGCVLSYSNCTLGQWSDWTVCQDLAGQSIRKREVTQLPINGGMPCSDSLEQTRPCPETVTNCKMGDWHDWTTCSATCGHGRKSRHRVIATRASRGGTPCEDVRVMTEDCMIAACPVTNCNVTDWSAWSECHGDVLQRYRHRVMHAGASGGTSCNDGLVETEGCPQPERPKGFANWEEWSVCSVKCGGGVRFRSRRLLSIQGVRFDDNLPHEMRTVEPCNMEACPVHDKLCEVSDWSEWGKCDSQCGKGSKRRDRQILKVSSEDNPQYGCNNTLSELAECVSTNCEVNDCKWGNWDSWSDCSLECGGGMRTRGRQVVQGPRNGGALCTPLSKSEVRPCNTQPCVEHCVDGTWAAWQTWSQCSASCGTGYMSRKRSVGTPPRNCGQPPEGHQEQFQPCPSLPSCEGDSDCELNEWSPWSDCSCTCFGVKERTRTIRAHATGNGRRCDHDSLKEVGPCNPSYGEKLPSECTEEPPKMCILSSWTSWTTCSKECDGGTKTRHRSIIQLPFRGATCANATSMVWPCNTQPCSTTVCKPCIWGDWSEWGDCTRCNGERWRHRDIVQMPNECGVERWGTCSFEDSKEVQACQGDCDRNVCAWSDWTAPLCSATCGNSATMRSRSLKVLEAMPDECYDFCSKTVVEVPMPVHPTKPSVPPVVGPKPRPKPGQEEFDCNAGYGNWQAGWSDLKMDYCCKYHGKACDAPEPFDCQAGLGQWQLGWSPAKKDFCCRKHQLGCPAKPQPDMTKPFGMCNEKECNNGLVWRDNPGDIQCCDQKGCVCTEAEMMQHCCTKDVPFDCEDGLAVSSKWEPAKQAWCCANEQLGCGKPAGNFDCHDDGHDIEDGWSATKKTYCCEHEQLGCSKRRLSMTFDCKAGRGQWQLAWSDTKKEYCCNEVGIGCGLDGNHGPSTTGSFNCTHGYGNYKKDWSAAKKVWCCQYHDMGCDAGTTSSCSTYDVNACESVFLHRSWERTHTPCKWLVKEQKCIEDHENAVTGCPKDMPKSDACANGEPTGGFLFESMGDIDVCSGTQRNISSCPAEPPCDQCSPVDCQFGEWAEWHNLPCMGLKQRDRQIKVMNNECGRPCQGTLTETTPSGELCDGAKETPGKLSPWSDWSDTCEHAWRQKTRVRRIVQYPVNTLQTLDGKKLQETITCCPIDKDCRFSEWTVWSPCNVECGEGTRGRTREIIQFNSPGHRPCDGSLHELEACRMGPCVTEPKTDCEFGNWDEWSSCKGKLDRTRNRKIVTSASGGGRQCEGRLQEIEGCAAPVVNCKMSGWTRWSDCDKSCGGGQHFRTRQIDVFPQNGGANCPSELVETKGCSEMPCNEQEDCEVGEWSAWGECSVSCDSGFQSRDRVVTSERHPEGIGCLNHLGETRVCQAAACPRRDCVWGDWEDWSACTCDCDGGMKTRNRHVIQMPSDNGAPCAPNDKEEVEPCNTMPCTSTETTINGEFSDWEDWSHCSATCMGGERYRTRFVQREANRHGTPAEGSLRQTEFCNELPCEPDLDCEFEVWSSWSACSSTCDGVHKRERRVKSYGKGNGLSCSGPLKETAACNEACGGTVGTPQDCVFEDWSSWTPCTVSCGDGQHSRSRTIAVPASNGGLQCTGPEEEMKECETAGCPHPQQEDCKLGEWGEWGACTKCAGQHTRLRTILVYPKHGGKACPAAELEDSEPCPRTCGEDPDKGKFCTWNGWTEWTQCSVSCGVGSRSRRKYLGLANHPEPSPPDLFDKAGLTQQYEALNQKLMHVEESHSQDLLVAFAAGCGCILLVFLVLRVFTSARRRVAPAGIEASSRSPLIE